jgi:hypothetical protein
VSARAVSTLVILRRKLSESPTRSSCSTNDEEQVVELTMDISSYLRKQLEQASQDLRTR